MNSPKAEDRRTQMSTAIVSGVPERLLELAHECLSLALQLDYLSNGSGHQQSTPLRALRAAPALKAGSAGTRSRDIIRQYLCEVATRKRLTSSEEYVLATRASRGDESARRRMIEHHLGLVVLIARPYRNRGLPLSDLIAEGNLGLLRASEKFDPERGFRFSTYAKWWIRQSIELALTNQASTVRVPVHVMRALKKQSKAATQTARTAESRLRPKGSHKGVLRGAGKFLLHDVRHQSNSGSSEPFGESQMLVDLVAAPEDEQPEFHLHLSARRKHLEAAMLLLKETERRVLQARFGLADDTGCTLESVALQLNLSSERVRQIQAEALTKLRGILQADHATAEELLL
jgi:RNA polymerase nonessential primary-like sigma factor